MTDLSDVLAWQRRFVRRAAGAADRAERGRILDEMLSERQAGFEDPAVRIEPVTAGPVPAEWHVPSDAAAEAIVLYLHGGGFVGGATRYDRPLLARIARAAPARVLGVDYRLAPAHPFPAAIDDAVAAYRWLLDGGTPAERIVVVCESAGATVGLLAVLACAEHGLPAPAGVALVSPFVDLCLSGPSAQEPSDADPMVSVAALGAGVAAFLGDRDPRDASPLFRGLAELPPLHVQVGGPELLGDDARRLVAAAREAGADAELVEYPGMPHTWQGFPALPEATQVSDAIAAFVRRVT